MDDELSEKQAFLRENILDKGYDAEEFMKLLQTKKGEIGLDLGTWSMEELQEAVNEFTKENEDNEETESEEEIEEDSDVIVSFKELEPVITEYKLAYISLKKRFPSTIIGYKKDETEVELGVSKWNPVSDYNEMLGTYSFAPVIDGHYEIDEEISLPEITVKVENEEMPTTGIADPETEVDKDEDKKPAKKGILSNLFTFTKLFGFYF